MKTQTAFIAKIDEGVFVSLEPKPELPRGHYGSDELIPDWQMKINEEVFESALKQWEDNLIRVEEARYPCNKGIWYWGGAWYFQPTNKATKEFVLKEGQQVEIQLTDNGCKIIKIK